MAATMPKTRAALSVWNFFVVLYSLIVPQQLQFLPILWFLSLLRSQLSEPFSFSFWVQFYYCFSKLLDVIYSNPSPGSVLFRHSMKSYFLFLVFLVSILCFIVVQKRAWTFSAQSCPLAFTFTSPIFSHGVFLWVFSHISILTCYENWFFRAKQKFREIAYICCLCPRFVHGN